MQRIITLDALDEVRQELPNAHPDYKEAFPRRKFFLQNDIEFTSMFHRIEETSDLSIPTFEVRQTLICKAGIKYYAWVYSGDIIL